MRGPFPLPYQYGRVYTSCIVDRAALVVASLGLPSEDPYTSEEGVCFRSQTQVGSVEVDSFHNAPTKLPERSGMGAV